MPGPHNKKHTSSSKSKLINLPGGQLQNTARWPQALGATWLVNAAQFQKYQALISSTSIFLKVAVGAKGHREAEVGGANKYKDHLPLSDVDSWKLKKAY